MRLSLAGWCLCVVQMVNREDLGVVGSVLERICFMFLSLVHYWRGIREQALDVSLNLPDSILPQQTQARECVHVCMCAWGNGHYSAHCLQQGLPALSPMKAWVTLTCLSLWNAKLTLGTCSLCIGKYSGVELFFFPPHLQHIQFNILNPTFSPAQHDRVLQLIRLAHFLSRSLKPGEM